MFYTLNNFFLIEKVLSRLKKKKKKKKKSNFMIKNNFSRTSESLRSCISPHIYFCFLRIHVFLCLPWPFYFGSVEKQKYCQKRKLFSNLQSNCASFTILPTGATVKINCISRKIALQLSWSWSLVITYPFANISKQNFYPLSWIRNKRSARRAFLMV